ncbi:MAG: MFS transporter [candidate division WOR-3 bacterium]|nr:MAG: MFS transporter [candidate division WOR-3 bacterium]
MSSNESKVIFTSVDTLPEPTGRLPRMIAALHHRNFRLFWFGQMVSLVGTWMQNVARGWLVLQMTNSPFLLGLVSMLGTLPVLFVAPFGGALADNLNKRTVVITTQITAMVLAFALATLVLTKQIQYWHILVLASILGVTMAIDSPTRQSFIVEIVGKKDLLNAIALNSSIFNLARIVGPAMAGLIISAIGIVLCFYLNGISYLAVIIGLFMMKGNFNPTNRKRTHVLRDIREGFGHARRDKNIMSLILLVALSSIFIMPFAMLMPVFARDILKVGAKGLGMLLASAGVGALIGALSLAFLSDYRKKGRFVIAGTTSFVIATILFSLSNTYYVSLILLLFLGWGMVMQNASINSLLQTITPDHLRGRIMSLYVLFFIGMMPFGSLQAGFIADHLGAQMALRIGGIIVACAAAVLFLRDKELIDLQG